MTMLSCRARRALLSNTKIAKMMARKSVAVPETTPRTTPTTPPMTVETTLSSERLPVDALKRGSGTVQQLRRDKTALPEPVREGGRCNRKLHDKQAHAFDELGHHEPDNRHDHRHERHPGENPSSSRPEPRNRPCVEFGNR